MSENKKYWYIIFSEWGGGIICELAYSISSYWQHNFMKQNELKQITKLHIFYGDGSLNLFPTD